MLHGEDLMDYVDREMDRRREEGLCVRCGHPKEDHPWTQTHHTGCDAVHKLDGPCACKGFVDYAKVGSSYCLANHRWEAESESKARKR